MTTMKTRKLRRRETRRELVRPRPVTMGDIETLYARLHAVMDMLSAIDRDVGVLRDAMPRERTTMVSATPVDAFYAEWRTAFGGITSVDAASLKRFLRELPAAEIRQALVSTKRARETKDLTHDERWRYFCKVCWVKIRAKQEADNDAEEDLYE